MTMEATSVIQRVVDPILVSIEDAAMMIGRGTTFIYECLGDGTLKAVKSNARTLVVVDSLRAYAASLPPAKVKPVPKRLPPTLRKKTVA